KITTVVDFYVDGPLEAVDTLRAVQSYRQIGTIVQLEPWELYRDDQAFIHSISPNDLPQGVTYNPYLWQFSVYTPELNPIDRQLADPIITLTASDAITQQAVFTSVTIAFNNPITIDETAITSHTAASAHNLGRIDVGSFVGDEDNDVITFAVQSQGLGGTGQFTISNTGQIAAIGSNVPLGIYTITVTASDAAFDDSLSFTLTHTLVDNQIPYHDGAPSSVTIVEGAALDGTPRSYTLSIALEFFDDDPGVLTTGVAVASTPTGATVTGLAYDPSAAVPGLTAELDTRGDYVFSLSATDAQMASSEYIVSVSVTGGLLETPLGDAQTVVLRDTAHDFDAITLDDLFHDPDGETITYQYIVNQQVFNLAGSDISQFGPYQIGYDATNNTLLGIVDTNQSPSGVTTTIVATDTDAATDPNIAATSYTLVFKDNVAPVIRDAQTVFGSNQVIGLGVSAINGNAVSTTFGDAAAIAANDPTVDVYVAVDQSIAVAPNISTPYTFFPALIGSIDWTTLIDDPDGNNTNLVYETAINGGAFTTINSSNYTTINPGTTVGPYTVDFRFTDEKNGELVVRYDIDVHGQAVRLITDPSAPSSTPLSEARVLTDGRFALFAGGSEISRTSLLDLGQYIYNDPTEQETFFFLDQYNTTLSPLAYMQFDDQAGSVLLTPNSPISHLDNLTIRVEDQWDESFFDILLEVNTVVDPAAVLSSTVTVQEERVPVLGTTLSYTVDVNDLFTELGVPALIDLNGDTLTTTLSYLVAQTPTTLTDGLVIARNRSGHVVTVAVDDGFDTVTSTFNLIVQGTPVVTEGSATTTVTVAEGQRALTAPITVDDYFTDGAIDNDNYTFTYSYRVDANSAWQFGLPSTLTRTSGVNTDVLSGTWDIIPWQSGQLAFTVIDLDNTTASVTIDAVVDYVPLVTIPTLNDNTPTSINLRADLIGSLQQEGATSSITFEIDVADDTPFAAADLNSFTIEVIEQSTSITVATYLYGTSPVITTDSSVVDRLNVTGIPAFSGQSEGTITVALDFLQRGDFDVAIEVGDRVQNRQRTTVSLDIDGIDVWLALDASVSPGSRVTITDLVVRSDGTALIGQAGSTSRDYGAALNPSALMLVNDPNETVEYTLIDPAGTPYSAITLPTGIALDTTTGRITATSAAARQSLDGTTLRVTDDDDNTSFDLNIRLNSIVDL
ncbi:MAG: hypothetical protein K0U36_04745, partial [Alphaproteobacteria bacterium]|nr:hypothetical protein [Alphaproteobacteria bacterium]